MIAFVRRCSRRTDSHGTPRRSRRSVQPPSTRHGGWPYCALDGSAPPRRARVDGARAGARRRSGAWIRSGGDQRVQRPHSHSQVWPVQELIEIIVGVPQGDGGPVAGDPVLPNSPPVRAEVRSRLSITSTHKAPPASRPPGELPNLNRRAVRLQMIFSPPKKEGPKPFFLRVVSAEADRLLTQRPLVIVHRVRAPSHHVDDDGGHVNL